MPLINRQNLRSFWTIVGPTEIDFQFVQDAIAYDNSRLVALLEFIDNPDEVAKLILELDLSFSPQLCDLARSQRREASSRSLSDACSFAALVRRENSLKTPSLFDEVH